MSSYGDITLTGMPPSMGATRRLKQSSGSVGGYKGQSRPPVLATGPVSNVIQPFSMPYQPYSLSSYRMQPYNSFRQSYSPSATPMQWLQRLLSGR